MASARRVLTEGSEGAGGDGGHGRVGVGGAEWRGGARRFRRAAGELLDGAALCAPKGDAEPRLLSRPAVAAARVPWSGRVSDAVLRGAVDETCGWIAEVVCPRSSCSAWSQ